MFRLSALGLLVLMGLGSVALVGCGGSAVQGNAVSSPAPTSPQWVQRVTLSAGASQSRFTEAGAQVLAWHPEVGFALLGWQQAPLGTLSSQHGEANSGQFVSPELPTSSVWASGRVAWGGSAGHGAWSSDPTTLMASAANSPSWIQIDLAGGRLLAPKLGAGVKVAVIDTGLDLNHPALRGHLAPATEWKDFVDGDALPQEVQPSGAAYGHGTGVAGVIVQIAPRATILPIRVLSPGGSGSLSAVVQALDWAIAKGANVINLSLGSASSSAALNSMLTLAASRQILLVASAGNAGSAQLTYPAAQGATLKGPAGNYLLAVGSVNAHDVKSTFSNYGTLDLVAPGENIYTAVPENQAGYWSGTSFAAPMVSGALALALGQGFDRKQVAKNLPDSSDDVKKVNVGYEKLLGKGRLNLGKFLKSLN